MKILCILQNAYGVEDGYVPSYSNNSFKKSYTGKRLKKALPEDAEIFIANASPKIGKTADSCFKGEPDYIKDFIDKINPNVILACGKIAEKTIKAVTVTCKILFMPHPAYRALTNKKLLEVKEKLISIGGNDAFRLSKL